MHFFYISLPLLPDYDLKMSPGGVLGISSDGNDRMEPEVKTQKNP